MPALIRWWWPIYVFIFPLVFFPFGVSFLIDFTFKFLINITFITLGTFLEFYSHKNTHLKDIFYLFSWLKRNPVIFLVSAYGIWIVISSFFTRDSALAFSGSVNFNTFVPVGPGSVFWELSFCVIFILIYVRSTQQSDLKVLLFSSVIFSSIFLAFGAIAETFTARSIFTGEGNIEGQLPYVSFSGRGHLAGYLCLAFSAILYAKNRFVYVNWIGLLVCLAIGTTQNRSSILAILSVLILLFLKERKFNFTTYVLPLLFVSLGAFFSQQTLWKDTAILLRTQGDLTSGRSLLWTSALNGIRAEPIFGWGGVNFRNHWADFLSQQEREKFFESGIFGGKYKNHSGNLFVLKDAKGQLVFKTIDSWYAHNDLLDKSLAYGIVGYLLYFSIVFTALINGWRENLDLPIFAFQIFLITWFALEASQGAYWCFLALAASARKPSIKSVLSNGIRRLNKV